MALPAKKRNNRKQNDYKRKQFQVIFFGAGNKSLKLLSHGARPFRHCRSIFHHINTNKLLKCDKQMFSAQTLSYKL